MKPAFSLIIDDGAPIDPMFYERPGYRTSLLVPAAFTRRVAGVFQRYDLAGKFTVIPMPSCLGRVDQRLELVPPRHLADFLDIVRSRIAPRFDITPEFLTHSRAYKLNGGGFLHLFEDAWISSAPLNEIVEYFALAFHILRNVGLNATGITSPWVSGIDVEDKYARAVADAQWRVFHRKTTWYFLHMADWGPPIRCSLAYRNQTQRQAVVAVPANCADVFWTMGLPTVRQRRAAIRQGIDRLLAPDGRSGRVRDLVESGHPVTLLTHWQCLFAAASALGLEGLSVLVERIRRIFGKTVEWVPCSELARRCVSAG